MRVLYIGDGNPSSTSCHRANALRRIGHQVDLIDPYRALSGSLRGWRGAWHYRTGYVFTRWRIIRWLRSTLRADASYDVCWVDSGELLSAEAIELIRRQCHQIVLYNHDDPTGRRDYVRFYTLRQAVSRYDLCVVVRPVNVAEFQALGAPDVMNVWRRYDEVAHHEPASDLPVPAEFQSDVAFIGFSIKGEGRDLFVRQLAQMGLNVAVWGDNWSKSKIWADIRPYWRGPSLSGLDYVNAIRGAKVCLGLLSKGNRDEHTTRTLEIPYAGGLLCAQRTPEHRSLFEEGKEAVFWSSAEECAAICKKLMADPALREQIRKAGQRKVIQAQLGNEDLGRAVFERLQARSPSAKA